MMELKLVAAMSLMAFLTGCVSPRSVMEVRTGQKRATSICTPLSVEEAVARIGDGWKRCIRDNDPGTMPVMVNGLPIVVPIAKGAEIFVNIEPNDNGQTVSLGLAEASAVLMIADIRKTESCAALVEARGWNMVWNHSASKVRLFLEQPDARCPR